MDKLLPDRCPPTSHRHDATSLPSGHCSGQLQRTQPTLALQGLIAAALLSFLFKKNKPLSPFLPAKEAREDWTNAEDKLPTWPLASLLALQESSHFPTELISRESYRALWTQGQEVEGKASVDSAPAGLVALSSP